MKELPAGLKWRGGIIHVDFMWGEDRIRESLKTADPKLAEVRLGELKSALYRGTYVPSSRGAVAGSLSLTRAFDLAYEGPWLLQAAEGTRDAARHNFARLTRGDHAALDPLMPARALDKPALLKLQRTLIEQGLAPATVNARMWVVRALLEAAVAEGSLKTLPELPRNLKVRSHRTRYLTPEEERLVLAYLGGEDRYADLRDAFVLMLDTGTRVMEAATLTARNFDLRQGTLRIFADASKNGEDRVVPLTRRVLGIVQRRLEAYGGVLFQAPAGSHRRYWNDRFGSLWREARAALGLHDVVLHTTRHTTGTRLMEAGTDLRTAMAYLGHKTPAMTLMYAKTVGANLRGAAAALERIAEGEGSSAASVARSTHKLPEGQ